MVEEEGSSEVSPAIKIYDDDINMKFLLCGVPSSLVSLIRYMNYPHLLHLTFFFWFNYLFIRFLVQDPCLLGSLEDGLNALLNIEVWTKAL
jgi:hypothetical protein